MKLHRKPFALGLAAAVIAATAGVVAAAHAAHAATANPSVTVPAVTAVTDSSVSLTWTLSNGAVKAGIQVYPTDLLASAFHENLTGNRVTVTGLEDDTTYYVHATAIDAKGKAWGWTAPTLFFTKSSFGVGQVWVDTGSGYTMWAHDSTALESNAPGGDDTTGVFRFTCTNVTAGCNIQLRAYATAPGYKLSPRILVYEQVGGFGVRNSPLFAEYGDGANNAGATFPLTTTAATVPVGYGTTWDSTGTNSGSPDGATVLNVPGGASPSVAFYDVYTTWIFTKS